jgi:diguanylate cyclase (GGDEF)-like protein
VTWVHGTAVPLKDDGDNIIGYLGTATDVTERKQAEWLERDRREVLELVAQNLAIGDVVDRLVQLVERQIGDGSTAMILLEEGGMNLHATSLPAELDKALRSRLLAISSVLAADTSDGRVEIVITEMTADRIPLEILQAAEPLQIRACWAVAIHSTDGAPLGILTVFSQRRFGPTESEASVLMMVSKLATISIEHHNTTQQLSHLVRHDPLTRLPNRIMCEDRMQQALAIARRSGKSVAVMVLDIDKFKSINDTLGHDAGDHLLQQVAQRLQRNLRKTDTVARIGGDEFVVVLPEIANRDDAAVVAQKLVESLAEPMDLGHQCVHATTSIGIALFPQDGEDAVIVQKKADDALYRAKDRGRNWFAF